jgi:hypothetical protein
MRISSPPPAAFTYGAQPVDQQVARRTAATTQSPSRVMSVAQLVASENRNAALSGTVDFNDATLADFAGQTDAITRRTDIKL